MSGTSSPDPDPQHDRLPPGVDFERLSDLIQQATEIRDSGDDSFIDTALKPLSATQREAYRPILVQRVPSSVSDVDSDDGNTDSVDEGPPPTFFASIDDLAKSLIATEMAADGGFSDPAGSSSPVGFDATIDTPTQYSATSHKLDLPPAKRSPQRKRSGDGSPLPERVGKFAIKGELGRGAFGVVYLGFDEELQRNVAIKVSLVADPHLQERLRIEASKVAQVESNGIVPVYHIGTTESKAFYIVQKYIKGSSLRDIVKQGPLSPARAARLIRDIAFGLEPAHLQDILHRDLKPDNILMEENGRAWIADFGLAISEKEQTAGRRELAGTLPYMSPEQINGRIDFLDPRSDIWALGVMYYELLTGKLPFGGKTRQVLTEQICERDPRPLQQRAPGILTEEMNAVFVRCCAKKPSERFATVRELAIELDQMLMAGLSDQNINGDSMESRFGESTIEYATANSRFASARSRIDSQQTHHESGRMSTATDSHFGSGSGALSASGSMSVSSTPLWLSAVKFCGAIIAIIALSIGANVGYQRYITADATEVETDPDRSVSIEGDSSVANSLGVAAVPRPDANAIASGDGATESPGVTEPIVAKPPFDADGSFKKPFVVAADGSGSHDTIAAALAAAPPDAYIRLSPGLYDEAIRIISPCTILGVARLDKKSPLQCEIESGDQSPITIDCPVGEVHISHLFVDGKGRNREAKFNAVDVLGGTLSMNGCELETSSQNCIKVLNQANLVVRDCRFIDSNEFSISTKNHGTVEVIDSLFDASGVQLVGGGGMIKDCKFYGRSGVHVAENSQSVNVSDCVFSGNTVFGLSATTGGKLIARQSTIDDCVIGIQVVESSAASKQGLDPVAGAVVDLFGISIDDCETAVIADGGAVVLMSENCSIRGGDIGVGIGIASVSIVDATIGGVKERAIFASDNDSRANLTRVNFTDCQNIAIYLPAGDAMLNDVSLKNCGYGIQCGEDDYLPDAVVSATLSNVQIIDCQSIGVTTYFGSLTISDSSIGGGSWGLLGKGDSVDSLSDPPAGIVTITNTKFDDQESYCVVASGDILIKVDESTMGSIKAGKGAKEYSPGSITRIEAK